MRHRKLKAKLGRTSSHRRCLMANMLKSLVEHESIETTVAKAKELRRLADQLVTLAKEGTLQSRRAMIAKMMVRFNPLSTKEARAAKKGDFSAYNTDRRVVRKLFDEMAPRYSERDGGYTRIIRMGHRSGDRAPLCLIEYI